MSATSDHGRPLKDDPQVEAVTVEADVDIEKRPSSPGAHSSMAEDARRAKEASEVILDQAPSAAAETDPQPVPFELHNLFKAQEAATLQARTLLPTTDHTILRLNSIRLQGDAHIRPSFAASFFRPYVDPNASSSPIQRFLHSSAGRLDFPPVAAPTTLTGIIQLTGKISQDLQRLGIYKDITPEIRPAAVPASHGTAVEDVDILLTLTPASRYQLQTSTQISTEDGGVSVRGKIDNVFGGAEKLEGSYERARRTKEAMNVSRTILSLSSLVRSQLTGALPFPARLPVQPHHTHLRLSRPCIFTLSVPHAPRQILVRLVHRDDPGSTHFITMQRPRFLLAT